MSSLGFSCVQASSHLTHGLSCQRKAGFTQTHTYKMVYLCNPLRILNGIIDPVWKLWYIFDIRSIFIMGRAIVFFIAAVLTGSSGRRDPDHPAFRWSSHPRAAWYKVSPRDRSFDFLLFCIWEHVLYWCLTLKCSTIKLRLISLQVVMLEPLAISNLKFCLACNWVSSITVTRYKY